MIIQHTVSGNSSIVCSVPCEKVDTCQYFTLGCIYSSCNKFPKHFLYSLKIFTFMQCFPKYILVIEKEPIVYVYNFYSSKIILYDTIKEQRHWQMLLKMSAMHRWLDGRWRWWKMVRMMKATQTSANWPCKHCNIKFKKFKNHN